MKAPRRTVSVGGRAKRSPVDILRATLVIHDAAEMTPSTAQEIAEWLRRRADEVEGRTRRRYAPRFTARYFSCR